MSILLLPTADFDIGGSTWFAMPGTLNIDPITDPIGYQYTDDDPADDETTYISTNTQSSGAWYELLLASPGDVPDTGDVDLSVRVRKSATGVQTDVFVELYSGVTLVTTLTNVLADDTVWATFSKTLTGPEVADITDWDNLRVRMWFTNTGGGAAKRVWFSRVSVLTPDLAGAGYTPSAWGIGQGELGAYTLTVKAIPLPVATIISTTVTKISRIATKDSFDVEFSATQEFIEYKVKKVNNVSDIDTQGTLIEQAIVSSRSSHTVSITDEEFVDTGLASEGGNIVKVFVKNAAGTWSV